jgi:hypothetical protein
MLVSVILGADFSRERTHPATQQPIPTTHPTPNTKTGAPLPGLRLEEGHAPLYLGRRPSLG